MVSGIRCLRRPPLLELASCLFAPIRPQAIGATSRCWEPARLRLHLPNARRGAEAHTYGSSRPHSQSNGVVQGMIRWSAARRRGALCRFSVSFPTNHRPAIPCHGRGADPSFHLLLTPDFSPDQPLCCAFSVGLSPLPAHLLAAGRRLARFSSLLCILSSQDPNACCSWNIMSPKKNRKSTLSKSSIDSSRQRPSNRNTSSRQANKEQVRHRASVACAACRDRRIRCVVPNGVTECIQCKKSGNDCVIKNDDERRRPISKAYMSSLSDRIALLEGMLRERGIEPPLAAHPPKTRHEAQAGIREYASIDDEKPTVRIIEQSSYSPLSKTSSPTGSLHRYSAAMYASESVGSSIVDPQRFHSWQDEACAALGWLDLDDSDLFRRLFSAKESLYFDRSSGQSRYYGSTTDSHILSQNSRSSDVHESAELVGRAELLIRSMTATTHDHLMQSFWTHYNSVLEVVHRSAFEADHLSQKTRFYSSFLHVCMLSMGLRFADADREDVKAIKCGVQESTFHREAKSMIDLDRPGGIPTIQALLLLSDLECGVGRDHTGWIYAGTANRIAFDIGLHRKCQKNSGTEFVTEEGDNVGQMVMRACVLYDKHWALFLGRPMSIKEHDISISLNPRGLSQLTSLIHGSSVAQQNDDMPLDICDQLVQLMRLAGQVAEAYDGPGRDKLGGDGGFSIFDADGRQTKAYLQAVSLDRQLQTWYKRLPERLQWRPSVVKSAPPSYFLLHQQYHVSVILLHRPWAKYDTMVEDGSRGADLLSHSPLSASERKDVPSGLSPATWDSERTNEERGLPSRRICAQQAIRVARIFLQQEGRFDGTKMFITAIQHAGTAAAALMAALSCEGDSASRRAYFEHLEVLSHAIGDMSQTYQPAARTYVVVKGVLARLESWIIKKDSDEQRPPAPALHSSDSRSSSTSMVDGDSNYSNLLGRRRSEAESTQPYKKRRSTLSSRRASDFSGRPSSFSVMTETALSQSLHGRRTLGGHAPVGPNICATNNSTFNLNFVNDCAAEHDDGKTRRELGVHEDSLIGRSLFDEWDLDGISTVAFEDVPGQSLKQESPDDTGYDAATSHALDVADKASVGWTTEVGEMEADLLGSVSLGRLVEIAMPRRVGTKLADARRNHELDFLAL